MLFELIKDHLFLSIYILINLIVFFLYGIDKWKAIHHKWRIPEAHLILAGVFGTVSYTHLTLPTTSNV